MYNAKIVEEIPKPNRSRSVSKEREYIQERLKAGDKTVFEGVAVEDFNPLQQRIRNAGKALGLRVTVIKNQVSDTHVDVFFEAKED